MGRREAGIASPLLFVGPIDRVLFLQSLPVYRDLGVGYLAAIAQHAEERFLRPGATWHEAGMPLVAGGFVIEGGLTVHDPSGAPPTRIGPGGPVGLLHLLAGEGSELRIVADAPTLLLEIAWEAQVDLCEEYFPILDQYLRYLARAERPESEGTSPEREIGWTLPSGRPLDLVERLEVLTSAAVLPAHALDALTELARHVTELRLPAGEVLWTPGDDAESFVLVLEGTIDLVGDGGDRVLRGSGSVVGMEAALGRQPRATEARTRDAVRGLRIELEAFLDILEDHFDVAFALVTSRARALLARGGGGAGPVRALD